MVRGGVGPWGGVGMGGRRGAVRERGLALMRRLHEDATGVGVICAYAVAWDQDRCMEMVDLSAYADEWPGGF